MSERLGVGAGDAAGDPRPAIRGTAARAGRPVDLATFLRRSKVVVEERDGRRRRIDPRTLALAFANIAALCPGHPSWWRATFVGEIQEWRRDWGATMRRIEAAAARGALRSSREEDLATISRIGALGVFAVGQGPGAHGVRGEDGGRRARVAFADVSLDVQARRGTSFEGATTRFCSPRARDGRTRRLDAANPEAANPEGSFVIHGGTEGLASMVTALGDVMALTTDVPTDGLVAVPTSIIEPCRFTRVVDGRETSLSHEQQAVADHLVASFQPFSMAPTTTARIEAWAPRSSVLRAARARRRDHHAERLLATLAATGAHPDLLALVGDLEGGGSRPWTGAGGERDRARGVRG